MAVQQNKKSPSKRGMHRSHNALNVPGIAVEPPPAKSTCATTSAPTVSTAVARCSRTRPKPDPVRPSATGPDATKVAARAFFYALIFHAQAVQAALEPCP